MRTAVWLGKLWGVRHGEPDHLGVHLVLALAWERLGIHAFWGIDQTGLCGPDPRLGHDHRAATMARRTDATQSTFPSLTFITRVTGPELTSSTSMAAPKTPDSV